MWFKSAQKPSFKIAEAVYEFLFLLLNGRKTFFFFCFKISNSSDSLGSAKD